MLNKYLLGWIKQPGKKKASKASQQVLLLPRLSQGHQSPGNEFSLLTSELTRQAGVVVDSCNPSTQDVGVGRSKV
jgi:hypothetical protein